MNELRKYAAIGGAIAIVACWPFATGKIGEAIFKDGIASYDNSVIKIENISYDRGYLSSQAQSRVYVTDKGLIAELEHAGYPSEIIVNHEIDHGLFSISSTSTVTGEAASSEFIKGLTLTTNSQLTGKTDLELISQDTNFVNADLKAQGVEKLYLAASKISATIHPEGEFSLQYSLPKTELRLENQSDMLIDNVSGKSEGKYLDDIFIGDANVAIDKMTINDIESNIHNVVNNVTYTSSNELAEIKDLPADNSLSSTNILKLGEVTTDAGTLKNGVFNISFDDLNYDALIKLVPLLQDQELTPEKIQQLMLSFDLLAAKGFSININEFSADVLGSKVESKVLLNLPAGTARASQNADQLVQTLKGNAELVIAKKLVDDTPELRMQMDELLINEFAVEEGDNYRLAATIADGQIELLNGQKMPLFMLLGLLSYLR